MPEPNVMAWQNPSWKSQFKNSVSTAKQKAKKNPTRLPKNLPHLNFKDGRCNDSTFAKEQSLEIR